MARHRAFCAPLVVRPEAMEGESYDEWWDALNTSEQRVEHIRALMSEGGWLPGVSHRDLAKEWKMTPLNLVRIAAEASRSLKRYNVSTLEQREAIKAQVLQTFQLIAFRALQRNDPASDRVAIEATAKFAQYLGLEPPKQIDLHDSRDEVDGWTKEQCEEFIQRRWQRDSVVMAVGSAPMRVPKAERSKAHRGSNGKGSNGKGGNGVH